MAVWYHTGFNQQVRDCWYHLPPWFTTLDQSLSVAYKRLYLINIIYSKAEATSGEHCQWIFTQQKSALHVKPIVAIKMVQYWTVKLPNCNQTWVPLRERQSQRRCCKGYWAMRVNLSVKQEVLLMYVCFLNFKSSLSLPSPVSCSPVWLIRSSSNFYKTISRRPECLQQHRMLFSFEGPFGFFAILRWKSSTLEVKFSR